MNTLVARIQISPVTKAKVATVTTALHNELAATTDTRELFIGGLDGKLYPAVVAGITNLGGTPSSITNTTVAASPGTSPAAARADHTHGFTKIDIPTGVDQKVNLASTTGGNSITGTSLGVDGLLQDANIASAAAWHGKQNNIGISGFGTVTTALVSGGSGAVGSSTTVARADHTHTLPDYPTLTSLGGQAALPNTAVGSVTLPVYWTGSSFAALSQANLRIGVVGTAAVGSETTPVFFAANGVPTASTSNVGSSTLPVYMAAGSITAMTAANLRLGAFGATAIGSTTLPVYWSGSNLVNLTQANLRIGIFGTGAIGNATTPVYFEANGVPTAGSACLPLSGGTLTGILNGTTINASDGFFQTSDAAFKKDITKLDESQIARAKQVEFISFTWKKSGMSDVGVIAQSTQKILPEVVATDEDGKLTVNYTKLLLLKVAAMEQEIKELKGLKGGV